MSWVDPSSKGIYVTSPMTAAQTELATSRAGQGQDLLAQADNRLVEVRELVEGDVRRTLAVDAQHEVGQRVVIGEVKRIALGIL